MTTFNTAFDWDANLPPSLSSLDENDFLLLLQKQFPDVTGQPIAPSTLAKGKTPVGPTPQQLPKFLPPNTTSPLTSDSSPSPSSLNEDGSPNESGDASRAAKRRSSADDEHHKRKVSADNFDDEIGGQPLAKSQHTDPKSKKTNTRRRSGGGEKSQDETRLLKRKEQNRAAQRAFRERKEKHVKDLEDRVAELLAKTENQATENENLRDMLSRLQNENVVLKQTAFTFSVPQSAKTTPDENRDPSSTPSEAGNLFASSAPVAGPSSVPASSGSSVATASSHDSPTLFESFDTFSGMELGNSTGASVTSASVPDMETIAFFGGPFTTVSSNPMYTSYRDPLESMNAFASFGGWDGDVNMGAPSTTSGGGLEDLFGEQFPGLAPFGGEFIEAKSSPSGSSGAAGATAGVSPVGHRTTVPLPEGAGEGCPKTKQDIERMVATGEKATFGAPPVIERSASSASSLGSSTVARPPGRGAVTFTGDNFNIDELCLEMQRKAKCSFACSGL